MAMRERYESALPFPEYLETVRKHEDLWRGVYERARVPRDILAEARGLPGIWRLLALSEDWCGDAVNILPVAWPRRCRRWTCASWPATRTWTSWTRT